MIKRWREKERERVIQGRRERQKETVNENRKEMRDRGV